MGKKLNNIIRLFNKFLNKKNTKIKCENIAKLKANLGVLKCYREKLKSIKKVGFGVVKKSNNKLKWDTVHSIFHNRITTGVILNISDCKDPKLFLNKCKTIFRNKIKKA